MRTPIRWLILLLWLTSCEGFRDEVALASLTREPVRLVVESYISPQSQEVVVKVTRSRPILNPDSDFGLDVADALVELSGPGQQIRLPYDAQRRYYAVPAQAFPIRAGSEYRLSVTIPAGDRVEASCRVPEAVSIRDILIDSLSLDPVSGSQTIRYDVEWFWTNPSSELHHFAVEGFIGQSADCPACGGARSERLRFPASGEGPTLVADAGPSRSRRSGRGTADLTLPVSASHRPQVLTAHLLHVDENYYQFHRRIAQQRATGGTPFAEPTPIPSNIRGGLGCFGAYNRVTRVVRLR